MKNLLFFALLFPIILYGQGVRYDVPPILTSNGKPVPTPTITLCPSTATIISAGTQCTPATAASFTDITLTSACSIGSPVVLPTQNACQSTGDANGNAGFWLAPGSYIYCVTGSGIVGKCFNLTLNYPGTQTVTTSIGSCLSGLPAVGGTCVVPPNYSETLAANIVLASNQHILFMGTATITMGNFSITAAHAIEGWAITSLRGRGFSNNSTGVKFIYTGTGCAFSIGDNSGRLNDVYLAGFSIVFSPNSNAGARGLCINSTQRLKLERVLIFGGSTAGQVGMVLDGTFAFAGNNTFDSLLIAAVPTGIVMQNNANDNFFSNLTVAATTGGIGVNFASTSSGNIFLASDVEGTGIAFNFANSANTFRNYAQFYGQGNTTDCAFPSGGAIANICDNIGAFPAAQVTFTGTPGTSNTIINPYVASIRTGQVPSSCAVTGAGASATCSLVGTPSDSTGVIRIGSAGAGPAASGTITLTFSSAFTNFGECMFSPSNVSTAWNARATAFATTAYSPTAPTAGWDNNAVALVAGNSYDIVYWCTGH